MILDANILLYAVEPSFEQHTLARAWLEDALNGNERVGFPWPSLLAFQRIVTHPRVMETPYSPADAWGLVTDWLEADQSWIPAPGWRHAEILGRLLTRYGARGNLVPDAHLAALAIEYGTSLCSFDSDFASFTELRWVNPAGS